MQQLNYIVLCLIYTIFFYMPNQKYCPTYIKYRFIVIEHGGKSLLECVVYMNFLVDSYKNFLVDRFSYETHPLQAPPCDKSF